MEERIKSIISRILVIPLAELTPDASGETIEAWDSLKNMKILLAIEEEFSIALSDDELVEASSLAQIVAIVSKHVS